MSSSETSDDENAELLREAVDTQFIRDDMFNRQTPSESKTKTSQQIKNQASLLPNGEDKDIQNQPSLRPTSNKADQFNTLGVTPQFQQYVAKQLSLMLEKQLNKSLQNGTNKELPRKRKRGGIKLFKNSTKYVKLQKSDSDLVHQLNVKNSRYKSIEHKNSESDNETKCSEVAVNSEDILNKKDVKNWSTRSKAPVFKYKKLENGTLTSVD